MYRSLLHLNCGEQGTLSLPQGDRNLDPDPSMEVPDKRWDGTFRSLAELEDAKAAFGDLGIMVVGGSGAGKSTLIRCLGFTDEAGARPQPSDGRRGEQDLYKVWRHPTHPLFVVDTNGVDTDGRARVAEVTDFLRKQEDLPFGERVHLIWYVLKVTDNRVLENAGLMAAVTGSRLRIPVQLVLTHMDQDPKRRAYARMLKNLGQLLAGVPECHQALRDPAQIVELCNVSWGEEAGLGSEEVGVSEEEEAEQARALQDLSRKTMAVLTEKQKRTWAAAQAVDVRSKLHETAKLIVSRNYLEALPEMIIGDNVAALMATVMAVGERICIIWGVPPDGALSKAVMGTVPWQELLMAKSTLLPFDYAAVAKMVLPWANLPCKEAPARTSPRQAFVSFSILIAASILFVRMRFPATWADKTQKECTALLTQEFQMEGLKAMLETLKLQGLFHGLWHGVNASVVQVEAFLTDFFHSPLANAVAHYDDGKLPSSTAARDDGQLPSSTACMEG